MVEQRFCKPKVAGSIPASGTSNANRAANEVTARFLIRQARLCGLGDPGRLASLFERRSS